jgi:hypothetical protein
VLCRSQKFPHASDERRRATFSRFKLNTDDHSDGVASPAVRCNAQASQFASAMSPLRLAFRSVESTTPTYVAAIRPCLSIRYVAGIAITL